MATAVLALTHVPCGCPLLPPVSWTENYNLTQSSAFPPVHVCENYCNSLYNSCGEYQLNCASPPYVTGLLFLPGSHALHGSCTVKSRVVAWVGVWEVHGGTCGRAGVLCRCPTLQSKYPSFTDDVCTDVLHLASPRRYNCFSGAMSSSSVGRGVVVLVIAVATAAIARVV